MISLIKKKKKKDYLAHVLRRQIFRTANYAYIFLYLIILYLSIVSYLTKDERLLFLNVFISGFLLLTASVALYRATISFTSGFNHNPNKWIFDNDGIHIIDDKNREDKFHWGNVKSISIDKFYIRVNWKSGLQSIIKCEHHADLGMTIRNIFDKNKSV